jgi:hypothetical protein
MFALRLFGKLSSFGAVLYMWFYSTRLHRVLFKFGSSGTARFENPATLVRQRLLFNSGSSGAV